MGLIGDAKRQLKREYRASQIFTKANVRPLLRHAEVAPNHWRKVWFLPCPFCDHLSSMEMSAPFQESARGDATDVRVSAVKHILREHVDALDASDPAELVPSIRQKCEELDAYLSNEERLKSQQLTSQASARDSEDPVAQIEKLADLRNRGVITAKEFEAKKAELLKRI